MSRTLSNAALLRTAELLGPITLRGWIGSLRATTAAADESLLPANAHGEGIIYAGWHEPLIASAALYGTLNPYTLVSKSRDGEYIARIVARLGWLMRSHGDMFFNPYCLLVIIAFTCTASLGCRTAGTIVENGTPPEEKPTTVNDFLAQPRP